MTPRESEIKEFAELFYRKFYGYTTPMKDDPNFGTVKSSMDIATFVIDNGYRKEKEFDITRSKF